MFTRQLIFSLLVLGLIETMGCASSETEQQAPPLGLASVLTVQTSGVEALFIGIHPVDENTVWISGTQGTYARTTDGGATWQAAVVAGAESLEFRDGLSAQHRQR